MIKIDNNTVINASQITQYKKYPMHESNYYKPETYKVYSRGDIWDALFHLDFSKKDLTLWYAWVKDPMFCMGNFDDLKKHLSNSKRFKVIDDKIYRMPHIIINLSDGKEHEIYFGSNEEMKKMEKKIIRKTRKR